MTNNLGLYPLESVATSLPLGLLKVDLSSVYSDGRLVSSEVFLPLFEEGHVCKDHGQFRSYAQVMRAPFASYVGLRAQSCSGSEQHIHELLLLQRNSANIVVVGDSESCANMADGGEVVRPYFYLLSSPFFGDFFQALQCKNSGATIYRGRDAVKNLRSHLELFFPSSE